MKIVIASPSRQSDPHQPGWMLSETVSELAFRPFLVEDVQGNSLSVDILFMISIYSQSFDGYSSLLSGCKELRSRTILRQMEPLPPPGFDEQAEQPGLEAVVKRSRLRVGGAAVFSMPF